MHTITITAMITIYSQVIIKLNYIMKAIQSVLCNSIGVG